MPPLSGSGTHLIAVLNRGWRDKRTGRELFRKPDRRFAGSGPYSALELQGSFVREGIEAVIGADFRRRRGMLIPEAREKRLRPRTPIRG